MAEGQLLSQANAGAPAGVAVGRAHLPAALCPRGIGGPTPVVIRDGLVFDASAHAPTVADLLERADLLEVAGDPGLTVIGTTEAMLHESHHSLRRADQPYFLAPVDLQVIKAAGVTFVESLIERVIEERSAGDRAAAAALREKLASTLGGSLRDIQPGSAGAADLAAALRREGLWSQYLEVGIGTNAEIFTKAPVLAAVGVGELIGIRSDSAWNNPEPEIVLAVTADVRVVGAAVGNDVNLRDFEGRSALLLGSAKDNTASCAIGPWFRLFDDRFTLESLMTESVTCRVVGERGFETAGANELSQISRPPLDLVRQATGDHHQYPDGFVLFLGTMYVPGADRGEPGRGFTHEPGDRVEIGCASIGTLINWVQHCEDVPSWSIGIRALYANLIARDLVQPRP